MKNENERTEVVRGGAHFFDADGSGADRQHDDVMVAGVEITLIE